MHGQISYKTRGLKNEVITPRTNDDVHTSVKLCPIVKHLMSTPQMQRLRHLHQLGVSFVLYNTTTHKRFEHSLGAMDLAGKMLGVIVEQQPRLGITAKDVKCVEIAALLHDIGHGPYSHVFDGTFRRQLRRAERKGSWLGRDFSLSAREYDELPGVMEGWAHEDASLMMIDAMLRDMGLEIDGSDLDAPLRQIGDGVDARRFGIWDRGSEPEVGDSDDESADDYDDHDSDDDESPFPPERVLTSRDWIFIKECIVGGPLPPRGMSIEKFKKSGMIVNAELVGRPHPHKEFLYDIVSNRHSGLDVDKMDYLARDTWRAHGSNGVGDLVPKLTEKAFVAWGECSDRLKCWRCRQFDEGGRMPGPDDRPGYHTMICYQESVVSAASSFFKKRYEEFLRLYTHHKTSAAGYEICDILLLAEPHFRLSIMNESDNGDDDEPPPDIKYPMSRAPTNADAYLELTDAVIDKIMNDSNPKLRPARRLIKQFREHGIYKRIHTQIITDKPWTRKLWGMDEDEIVEEVLRLSEADALGDEEAALEADDIIIEKREIHHGMKDKNPVNSMRFLQKKCHRRLLNRPEKLPVARRIPDSDYAKSDKFLQRSVRVICRSLDAEKRKRLGVYYERFLGEQECSTFEAVEEYDAPQTPTRGEFNDPVAVSQSQESPASESPALNEYNRGVSLLEQVRKRARCD